MVGDGCNEVSGNARPLFAKSELGGFGVGLGWLGGAVGDGWGVMRDRGFKPAVVS